MSTGYVVPSPKFRAFDVNGDPLAAGKLYTYQAGTSNPLATYSDQALVTPNVNPVVLDANGEATIYIPGGTLYKFVLKSSGDVTQWTVDNVKMPADPVAAVNEQVPTGAILPYGGGAAPTNFLLCDGSAVSRVTYSALFAVTGTVFGAGDGATTFNLPDLRGRFPIGKAAAGTGSTLGGTGGTIDHTHTIPDHTHDVVVPRDGWGSNAETPPTTGRMRVGNAGGAGADATGYFATANQTKTSGSPAAVAPGTLATTTGNPPFQAVNFIIRT